MAAGTGFRVVIPARFGSTRFPGKVLAPLAGRPMIQHVFDHAVQSGATEVVIATDDERIQTAAQEFGAAVAMTRADHVSGTDRIAEVVARAGWSDAAVVVNVQGDAPLLPPARIAQVANLLQEHSAADMATLCTAIDDQQHYFDANVVKVVMDRDGRALYFSRSPIPAAGHGDAVGAVESWRHLGIYAYRVAALATLTSTGPCYLEKTEKLEQLRALWLGMEIRVGIARESLGPDVDTPEDLEAAARFLAAR
ncbi:MAG: 3-deoxy-manno-octulosonate cytidylyltransferase [Gammaproteobacteria bacterium]|nr:3-deoxy-manno-octulosonate cytidylyltransferase [Gammaproteobacteria bacterium]